MRTKIYIIIFLITFLSYSAPAQEPVHFADANLKAAVEEALDISNPTTTDMLNLTSLSCHSRGIVDLTGLEYATNLTDLNLNDNQISDISALSGLINLQILHAFRNLISDISPLSGLENLTVLIMIENRISDLSPLSKLTSLKNLRLATNQISDISALSDLTNLMTLELSYNQISDISALAHLTNLTNLSLFKNQINDISALAHLTNLMTLGLSYNQISDISALTELQNLNRLDLLNNPLNYDDCYIYIPLIRQNNPGIDIRYDPCTQLIFFVDDNGPNDPGPFDPQISDPNEDGTPDHPYDTILEAINAAEDTYTVLVYPGVYSEQINFLGKFITVLGIVNFAGIAVLENPDGYAVAFENNEGPESILKNFIIRNSAIGVFIDGSFPTISNLTIVNNKYGIEASLASQPDISSCILWNNSEDDLFQCRARYSCIERASQGEGNISLDPLFADPNNGDFHLLSEHGRYWPEHDIWILDEITSPCIDAGDPNVYSLHEPLPNGGRINMGAYGNTPEASLSEWPQPFLHGQAHSPNPADGATDVLVNSGLGWAPGLNAASHDVYVGNNRDAVADANTSDTTGIYRGRQSTNVYSFPDYLVGYESYYWRIDEVDGEGNIITGLIWSFSTIPLMPGPKGRGCFLADTPVWVDGALVPISKVVSGQNVGRIDCVNIKNSPAQLLCFSAVEKLQEHEGMFECRDILLESGNRISVVDAHCFMLDSGKWIAAQNLRAGLRLKTLSSTVGIKSVTTRAVPFIGQVYNLKIKATDRYFVGKDGLIVRDY